MKKMIKKIKTKSKKNIFYSTPEMKHYLGALNETHNEHLKGIREGSIIVNKKLDNLTSVLDSHTKTLDSHTKILNEHTKKLDSHSKILNSHTEMIGILLEDVSVIKSDLKRKVDYDDFLSLVRRVQKIESKI